VLHLFKVQIMRVLAVGGGGREHAIVRALYDGGAEIYTAMKNRNPGIARASKDFELIKETDVEKVVDFAVRSKVEMAVIGPEAPLEVGLVDALESEGIGCVGASKDAARIETSKSFMRNLMRDHAIEGNLDFAVFDSYPEAKEYVMDYSGELAVKPVGLTGGKGVKIQGEHLLTKEAVLEYVKEILDKGIGGGAVVLEERGKGEEFTLQAFCDGRTVVPMPVVQDHKRAYEGDRGPNTGGMGSYSMADHSLPFMTQEEYEGAMDIMAKTVTAMREEGCPYVGVLYGQFMLTRKGPRVIEYNARFGDPEAMNVLPILTSNFLDICEHIVDGRLASSKTSFAKKATVCKYVVPEGYGTKSKAGLPIKVDEKAIDAEGVWLYYAAVNEEEGRIFTTTSRSLAIVGVEDTIEAAEEACERGLSHVGGEAIAVRHDIGKPDLIQRRMDHMKEIRG
jgi:phosphoribosylamine--glycine ligase